MACSSRKVLHTVQGRAGPPSWAEAAKQLGVGLGSIDREFGIIAIDPANEIYSVLVEEDPARQATRQAFANPKIEPDRR